MIVEMAKVQIIGPRAHLDECVKVLHAAAVVHIETVPAPPADTSGAEPFLTRLPMEKEKLVEREKLVKASERMRNFISLLSPPLSYKRVSVSGADIARLLDEAAPVEKKVRELCARREKLLDELSTVNKYEKLLRGFAPMVSRLGGLKNLDIMGLTVEKTRQDVVKLLEGEVAKITAGSYRIYVKPLDESTSGIVLAYPRQFDIAIRNLLAGKAISEVRLPEEYEEMTLFSALRRMQKKKGDLPGLVRDTETEMEGVSRLWYGTLVGLKEAIDDAVDEIGVLDYAGQTRFAFIIEGWVPAAKLPFLRGRFTALFKDRVLVRELEFGEQERGRIPVHIKNPWFIRPFEVFLGALPAPVYGTVDPTMYVAFFFPAFWGFIVGDVGYGGILLAVSLILRRRLRHRQVFRDILTVLAISSASAIFFGLLYGELFGDLGERLGILHPILFERAEAIKPLAIISLGIGMAHILLGVAIGAVNRFYGGRMREAVAKAAYFVLIASFIVIICVIFGYLPRKFLTPGAAALIASFITLTVMEGILGPLEFVKAIGNIVSYLRIMAVGMASVVMALVANRIGGLSDNMVIGIIAAGSIHTLNLALSVLSPSIQSMRLQYVEFFSKFYEGGGRKYQPFRKR
ncbi:MAG: V-type ATP synthase subunit I [Thermodesulfobacteriota bacterium]